MTLLPVSVPTMDPTPYQEVHQKPAMQNVHLRNPDQGQAEAVPDPHKNEPLPLLAKLGNMADPANVELNNLSRDIP